MKPNVKGNWAAARNLRRQKTGDRRLQLTDLLGLCCANTTRKQSEISEGLEAAFALRAFLSCWQSVRVVWCCEWDCASNAMLCRAGNY